MQLVNLICVSCTSLGGGGADIVCACVCCVGGCCACVGDFNSVVMLVGNIVETLL